MLKKQAGFTLVELAVAIVVIGIVGASITSLYLGIQQRQMANGYKESALRAAHTKIESLRNRNYNNLVVGEDIDFTSELPDELPSNKNAVAAVSEPSPGLKRVDVTVSYEFEGRDRTVKLSSLIGVIGITQ